MFTSQQWLSGLLPEVTSARSVFASADRLLRQDGALERDLDAVQATYSIGVECLMRLLLALQPSPEEKAGQKDGLHSRGMGPCLG